jgi:hypothetical protein
VTRVMCRINAGVGTSGDGYGATGAVFGEMARDVLGMDWRSRLCVWSGRVCYCGAGRI